MKQDEIKKEKKNKKKKEQGNLGSFERRNISNEERGRSIVVTY